MKQMLTRMMVVAVLAYVGVAKAESVTLVEITDLQKKTTYEIKTSQEFKELKKTLDAEAHVFPKALELTKKEWETSDKGAPPAEKPKPGEKVEKPAAQQPFPASMLSFRKCAEKGNFADREKAQKRLDQMESSAADVILEKAKKNMGKVPTPADKLKAAREAERDKAADKAAVALQAKIDELVKAAASVAATNAVPAVAK